MVTVTISETYDLSTKTGKMSIVGIHTPTKALIAKSYPGLAINSKMFKFVKCDVKMACAQMLPADPLQVGVSAGKIAPQDMFNPILYKAMSNEAMGNFELRVHGLRSDSAQSHTPALEGTSVIAQNDGLGAGLNDEEIYYNLLANHKGWKIAHPQRGLSMASLRPYVYEALYDAGQNSGNDTSTEEDNIEVISNNSSNVPGKYRQPVKSFRGRPHVMPAINCTHLTDNTDGVDIIEGFYNTINQNDIPDLKPIYVACILLPPSKLNVLYYRLVVRWTIAFLGIRPIQEIVNWYTLQANAGTFYGSDYTFPSSKMDTVLGMVDSSDSDLSKVMEGI